MATRNIPLVSGEYYHVFNRGITQQPTYLGKRDYSQMLLDLSYYRFTTPPLKLSLFKTLNLEQRSYLWKELQYKDDKLTEAISFAFMPNHFHLLLRQTADNGISTFMRRLSNSYTRFFNSKYERKGSLFQGAFKAVHISSSEQLVHVSRYLHINPVVSCVIKQQEMFDYPWTSLPEFLEEPNIVNPEPVLSFFSSKDDYRNFVLDQVDYGKRLEEIKRLILE